MTIEYDNLLDELHQSIVDYLNGLDYFSGPPAIQAIKDDPDLTVQIQEKVKKIGISVVIYKPVITAKDQYKMDVRIPVIIFEEPLINRNSQKSVKIPADDVLENLINYLDGYTISETFSPLKVEPQTSNKESQFVFGFSTSALIEVRTTE